jgi:hypothetical protein
MVPRDHMHCPGTYSSAGTYFSLVLFCMSAHSDAIVGFRWGFIEAHCAQYHSISPSAPMPVQGRCTCVAIVLARALLLFLMVHVIDEFCKGELI